MGNKSSTELKSSMRETLHQLNLSAIHLPARQDHPPKRPLSTPSLRYVFSRKELTSLPHTISTPPPQLNQPTPPVLATRRADTTTLLTQPPSPKVPYPETTRPPSSISSIRASPFAPSPFATSLPKPKNSTITPGTLHTTFPPAFALSSPPSSGSSVSNPPILSPPTSSHSSSNNFPILSPPLPVTAPPVTKGHYNCYQAHLNVLFSKNEFCPVPCMLCNSEDEKGRWTCAWCSLRVCGGCRGKLKNVLMGEGVGARENGMRKEKQKERGDSDLVNLGGGNDETRLRVQEETAEEKMGYVQNEREVRDENEEEDLTLGHW